MIFNMTYGGLGTAGAQSLAIPGYLDYLSSSPQAALSLKKLISSATNAIRVRRSNDNAEQDIGFTGDDLDTTSLLSFTGANSGYVTTIYDQTGNGENAVQATSTKQPRIVNAGAYDGAMIFDGTDDYMMITALANTGDKAAIYSKLKQSNGAVKVICETGNNYSNFDGSLIFYVDTADIRAGMNDGVTSATRRLNSFSGDLNTQKKVSLLYDRALTGTDEMKLWVNSSAATPTAQLTTEQTGNFASEDMYIASRGGTTLFANLELFTLVFYNVDTASLRLYIEPVIT